MPRHLLSALSLKSKLDSATAGVAGTGKTIRIGDGDGLMLVVRPHGAAWILRYSSAGRRTDLTLGKWPTVNLAMARKAADTLRKGQHEGVDPVEAVRARREPVVAPGDDTMRKLFDDWIAKQVHLSGIYKHNIEAAFKKDVFPALLGVPPSKVTKAQVLVILRAIEDRGAVVMVRRVRMWLRQMFEFGIEHEGRPALKDMDPPVPMGVLKSFTPIQARHFPAITNAADVAPLMRKIRATTDNWIIRVAFLLSAHLFQRPSEIREADWSEFDLKRAIWIIPGERMKGNNEHWVPLSRQVVELLIQHAGVIGDEGLLLPGRKYGMPISEGTLTGRLIKMGYDGKHSPHGFRAMARTVLDEHLKVDPRYIEKQLAHENDPSGLRGAYNRSQYWDERVKMMQLWSDWLDAQT